VTDEKTENCILLLLLSLLSLLLLCCARQETLLEIAFRNNNNTTILLLYVPNNDDGLKPSRPSLSRFKIRVRAATNRDGKVCRNNNYRRFRPQLRRKSSDPIRYRVRIGNLARKFGPRGVFRSTRLMCDVYRGGAKNYRKFSRARRESRSTK